MINLNTFGLEGISPKDQAKLYSWACCIVNLGAKLERNKAVDLGERRWRNNFASLVAICKKIVKNIPAPKQSIEESKNNSVSAANGRNCASF